MIMKIRVFTGIAVFAVLLAAVLSISGQSTAFSYQGQLSELGVKVTGTRIFRFTLFDENGVAIPGAMVEQNLPVNAGSFSTTLDFGSVVFPGANRTVEIAIKVNVADPYTVLSPKQPILATPYAIRSYSSLTAANANQLGGLSASQFVQQDGGGNVSIAGGLTVTGSLSLSTVNATTQYNFQGNRFLTANPVSQSLSLGLTSGSTAANFNTFVGAAAGSTNTTGVANSFFGYSSGAANIDGQRNSFFGSRSGMNNTTGSFNVFIGQDAGFNNTVGSSNTVVGASGAGGCCGFVMTGSNNSLFGSGAGSEVTSGTNNSFFGQLSGGSNTDGANNSFFGSRSGFKNTASDNAFFGSSAGTNNTTGDRNAFFGINSGFSTTTGCCNSFFGNSSGAGNTTGFGNAFFGGSAGVANTVGFSNTYYGDLAGASLSSGNNNTIIGKSSGLSILTGNDIMLAGGNASGANNLTNATAIGANSFVGSSNSMVLGSINGVNGSVADTNVGIGTISPLTRFQVKTATGNYGLTHTDGSISVGSYVGNSASGASGGWLGTQSNHKLFLFTNNGQPSLTVDTTGNVGVGTITPGSKLTVAGLIETTSGGVKFPDGSIQTTAGLLSTAAIANQTTQQAAANFNIDGTGKAAVFDSSTHYFLQGRRFISMSSENSNTMVGDGAGTSIADEPAPVSHNSFFGLQAGTSAVSGGNSFFGSQSGRSTSTGGANAFFGFGSGTFNTTGAGNTYIGNSTGQQNVTGSANTVLGFGADLTDGVNNSTAIGAGAFVTQSDSLVLGNVTDTKVGVGTTAPKAKLDVTGGNILVGSPGQGIILKSPDGATCKLMSIDNAGAMTLSPIACP